MCQTCPLTPAPPGAQGIAVTARIGARAYASVPDRIGPGGGIEFVMPSQVAG